MEPLPDLASLSDVELRRVIDDLVSEEGRVSYERRMLQGRIDILRAGLGDAEGGDAAEIDIESLAHVLAGRAPRPEEDSLRPEVRRELDELREQEREISFRRRVLHGKIDILRAELVARLQKVHTGGGTLREEDVQKLTDLLADKATPPDDLEREDEDAPGRNGA